MNKTTERAIATRPAGLSPLQLRPFFRTLYADASPMQRLLAIYRPSICPFEPIVRLVPSSANVLDFGCGSGALVLLLAAIGRIKKGIACDISTPAIATAVQASRHLSACPLEFRHISNFADLPIGPFDAVLMIDVLHHIEPVRWQEAVFAGAQRVGAGGLLIYKDMASKPAWRRYANTLHDLVIARQLVNYIPISSVDHWSQEAGLELIYQESYAQLVYGHELRVFRRAA